MKYMYIPTEYSEYFGREVHMVDVIFVSALESMGLVESVTLFQLMIRLCKINFKSYYTE